MPSIRAHIEQAEHNRRFLQKILEIVKEFADWVAVAAFYTALHYVEALFFRYKPQNQQHATNHEMRERLLKQDQRFKQVWRHYWHLWQASVVARYLQSPKGNYRRFADYISPEKVKTTLIEYHLNRLIKSVEKLLTRKKR